MRHFFFFLSVFSCLSVAAQNEADTSIYLCKYSFEWQKDSNNIFSKVKDMMYLEIGKNQSKYYSYFHFLGLKNLMGDIKAVKGIDYIRDNPSRYYKNSETEVIIHYFDTKEFKIIDKLVPNGITYCYTDKVEQQVWKLASDTLRILNQLCQKATSTYKDREYTAWFAPDIPFSVGPWQFTGLPGLILRIYDTKNQIYLECTELGNINANQITDVGYSGCLPVEKSKLQSLKKLKETDWVSFMKIQNPNLNFTFKNNSGDIIQPHHALKPYNPIDLCK